MQKNDPGGDRFGAKLPAERIRRITAPDTFAHRTTLLATCVGIGALIGGCQGHKAADVTAPAVETRVVTGTDADAQAATCSRLLERGFPDVSLDEAVALAVSERLPSPPAPQRTIRLEVPHCKVTGVIDGSIRFELLMPDDWNGKLLMGGGGGFVGTVANQAQDGLAGGPTPLERGYATVGTDTGHVGGGIDASWALGDTEAQINYAHRGVHRTAQVAKAIIGKRYSRGVERSYFVGCSNGGRQGLISAQRYPDDFDGIVAGAPLFDFPGTVAAFIRTQQVVFPDPQDLSSPTITSANRRLLDRSIRDACDMIDGVKDGVLNDPRRCDFDPEKLPLCTDVDTDECLTRAQIDAIATVYSGTIIAGRTVHPGFPFGGEADAGGWDVWITRPDAGPLAPGLPNAHYGFGTQFLKYFVHSDPQWTYVGYEFSNWEERVAPVTALLAATNPDLAAFRDRGGKLILWHGWSDPGLSALESIDYSEAVIARDPSAHDYFRLFLMPGVLHCGGGPGADRVDWIAAIEQWVERNVAPERLIASKLDAGANVTLARPLCPHPQVAQYVRSGDPEAADSFACGLPEPASRLRYGIMLRSSGSRPRSR